ncbi:UNVERIFIED_CONTAM: hypothetical protein FKN15_006781 [Acipenser sinensis]
MDLSEQHFPSSSCSLVNPSQLHMYILSIESAEEIEEYVGDLIQGTDGKKRQFIDELLEKWQRSRQRAPESVQLYRRNEEMDTEVSEMMRGCDALKKSKRKGRNKQETMIYTEKAPAPEEVKTPIDLAKAQESSPSSSSSSFKKKKFVSLYAKEGQDKLAILLPGRHPCECLAQKHKLINNCLTCGRIVCEQEGSGPCLFCGSLVCTEEEQEILQRDSNKSQKLRKKLMAGSFPYMCGPCCVSGVERGCEGSEKDVLPHEEARMQAGLEKALQHKDKLLEFDKNRLVAEGKILIMSANIHNCSFPYMCGPCCVSGVERGCEGSEKDVLPHEEARMQAGLEKALQHKDKLLEFDKNRFDDTVHALNTGSLGQSSKPADCGPRQHLRELVNPNIIQAAPVWVDLIDPAPLRKPQSSQLKGSQSDPSAERTRLRIQDKELQEIADDGCVRRTKVIDDESDYFSTDSNQWLSQAEREALRKRGEELRELRHASRQGRKITFDFAGRQILEEGEKMTEYYSNVRRTKVIDDESDYFSTDSNQWLSQAEREALRKRGEELRELRHASRQGRKITFDFAGRQILEEGEKMTEYYSKFDDTVHALNTGSLGQSSKPADCGPRQHLRELVNPNIIQAAPVWVDLIDPAPLRKPQSSQLKGSQSDPSAERTRLRIQDKELQEIADDGWCLSMHQPWASLLIKGIKSVRRTKVIDDESDYFSTDSNQWLSQAEREALRKRGEELRELRHASRQGRKITFDFAGRQILEEGEKMTEYYSKFDDTVHALNTGSLGQSSKPADCGPRQHQRELVNPNIIQAAPVWVDLIDPAPLRKPQSSQLKGSQSDPSAERTRLRIQDKELQEIADDGWCLSMHQPWASLLIKGIKRVEGRTWYSSHRGRLWIAAAGKRPTPQEISQVEASYRTMYKRVPEFPKEYPTGCLLGCVNMADCLSQEQFREQFQETCEESASPFVFICSNPQELVVKFPMKGKHKICKSCFCFYCIEMHSCWCGLTGFMQSCTRKQTTLIFLLFPVGINSIKA